VLLVPLLLPKPVPVEFTRSKYPVTFSPAFRIPVVTAADAHRARAGTLVGELRVGRDRDLGNALASYKGFAGRGFHVAAAFDADPEKIGHEMPGGLLIEDVANLETRVQAAGWKIGIERRAEGGTRVLLSLT